MAPSTIARDKSRSHAMLGLPPSWYLDPEVLERERRELFAVSPRFVGRMQMVPRDGDYVALEGANAGLLLVRHQGRARLVSNVCRHRQALMLQGRGNAKRIVCPVHNWAYGLDGCQVAAPHFEKNPCLDLPTPDLAEWRGLLFAGEGAPAADLAALDGWTELDADDYVLDRIDYEEHPLNWKSFLEVFLENYHVPAVHPGFRKFVNQHDLHAPLRAARGERFYAEMVSARWPLGTPGSPKFDEYQRLLLEVTGGDAPPFGAIWLTYFPSTLIEFYPYAMVVTSYDPLAPELTRLTSQYYFSREVRDSRPDFVAATHAVLDEVTNEDHEASVRLHAGRSALARQGVEYQGPYQPELEQGLRHFHAYLRGESPAGR
jgi:phenylpropionate dioxygenase-like ring-hydroxylating dioxygenase large terminal subunit